MTFGESIKTCFTKYADFSGRASRSEYWWWFLFLLLGNIAAGLISETVNGLFSLATISPDRGRWLPPPARHRQERVVATAQPPSGHRLDCVDLLGCPRRQRAERILMHFFLLFLLACSVQAETLTGRVVGIADGDTITVLDANRQQHKIGLIGIDAPEKAQPFGDRSKQNLSTLVFDKQVFVESNKQDRYGRTVGKVLVNGIDANLAQLKAGMAWWYRDYAKEQSAVDRRLYELAEQQAQTQRLGLWTDKNPTPPWGFRHAKAGVDVDQLCPCSGVARCAGPKGGRYCQTDSGGKKYQ